MMPRPLLLWLMSAAVVPMIAGIWVPGLIGLGILLSVGLFLFALVDLLVSPSPGKIDVRREVGEVLSVGAKNPVRLLLRNRNKTDVIVSVHDEPPAPCEFEDLPFHTTLRPGKIHAHLYLATPQHRGLNQFGTIFLQMQSRFKLWVLTQTLTLPQEVKIYPDIQAVRGVELLARMNRLAEAGVRMSRLKGRGSEFDRLREYRREDEYRSIDWKATSRYQNLISREYVVEKNQNILFVLDAGRSMCNEHEGINHFDRALNAAILLSYIALRQGDTVGMLVGSNRIDRWVPPVRGNSGVQSLIRQTYDLMPSYNATDYDLLVEQLRTHYRKRSLVIFVTHALDEVHLDAIGKGMRQLKRPHLVLGSFLRNVQLHERLHTIPKTDREAFQVAAAAELIASQTLQVKKLEKSGLLVLDSIPENLSSGMISNYLDIKARHLL
jgi:uncharacterized protein (DUF58 family)